MRTEIRNDIRFRKLRDELGGQTALARGLLECLFEVGFERLDYRIGDGEDVELAAEWEGKAGELLAKLVSARWVARVGDAYRLCECEDYRPDHIVKRHRRAGLTSPKELRVKTADFGGQPRSDRGAVPIGAVQPRRSVEATAATELRHEAADFGAGRRTTADDGAAARNAPRNGAAQPLQHAETTETADLRHETADFGAWRRTTAPPSSPSASPAASPPSSPPTPPSYSHLSTTPATTHTTAAAGLEMGEEDTGNAGGEHAAVLSFPVTGVRGVATWDLTAGKRAEYLGTYAARGAGWVDAELAKARQWCLDNPANRKTPRGMTAFLGAWLSRATNGPAHGPAVNGAAHAPRASIPGAGPPADRPSKSQLAVDRMKQRYAETAR